MCNGRTLERAAKRVSRWETVLFACTHNAGRSQMAAAFFNQLVDPAKARAISAGTQPAAQVHRVVVEAMRELAVDLSSATPQRLALELARTANLLVTMGCAEECPYVPGIEVQDWEVGDPKDQPVERVREIRDDIRRLVIELVSDRGLGKKAHR